MATGRKQEKQQVSKRPVRLTAGQKDDDALAEEILRACRDEQAATVAASKKFLKALGLEGKKPIGAKKLREMALREGINPEGTEFSRGIIEMREE
jgi:hypothetical protein